MPHSHMRSIALYYDCYDRHVSAFTDLSVPKSPKPLPPQTSPDRVLSSHHPVGSSGLIHLCVSPTGTSLNVLHSLPTYVGSYVLFFQCVLHISSHKCSCTITQPLKCVTCSGGLLLTSQLLDLEGKGWGPFCLLLRPWTLQGGLRIAKHYYITILLPSSVFSFVTWTLKNSWGSNFHKVSVPCVHVSARRCSFRESSVVSGLRNIWYDFSFCGSPLCISHALTPPFPHEW